MINEGKKSNNKKTCHSEFISESQKHEMLKQVQHDMRNRHCERSAAIHITEEQMSRGQEDKQKITCHPELVSGSSYNEIPKQVRNDISIEGKRTRRQANYVNSLTSCLPDIKTAKKTAFTLAEVLITLGIIGIVAAMTMPALIANYQKKQAVTRLKKVYSVINQAYNLSIAENGPAEYWEKPDGEVNKESVAKYVQQYWLPYFKSVQTCSKTGDCTSSINRPTMNGASGFEIIDNRRYTIILSDGTIIAFVPYTYTSGVGVYFGSRQAFYIDVNGDRKPNIAGKDSWILEITDGKLRGAYAGYSNTWLKDNCVNGNGQGCASLIINNAWVMPDNYPWK